MRGWVRVHAKGKAHVPPCSVFQLMHARHRCTLTSVLTDYAPYSVLEQQNAGLKMCRRFMHTPHKCRLPWLITQGARQPVFGLYVSSSLRTRLVPSLGGARCSSWIAVTKCPNQLPATLHTVTP